MKPKKKRKTNEFNVTREINSILAAALPKKRPTKKQMNWKQAKNKYPNMNPLSDFDKDGVPNLIDCRPFDKKKQDAIYTWQYVGKDGKLYTDNNSIKGFRKRKTAIKYKPRNVRAKLYRADVKKPFYMNEVADRALFQLAVSNEKDELQDVMKDLQATSKRLNFSDTEILDAKKKSSSKGMINNQLFRNILLQKKGYTGIIDKDGGQSLKFVDDTPTAQEANLREISSTLSPADEWDDSNVLYAKEEEEDKIKKTFVPAEKTIRNLIKRDPSIKTKFENAKQVLIARGDTYLRGQYNPQFGTIEIRHGSRKPDNIISTIHHEFKHDEQENEPGKNYAEESEKKGYTANKFEVEARYEGAKNVVERKYPGLTPAMKAIAIKEQMKMNDDDDYKSQFFKPEDLKKYEQVKATNIQFLEGKKVGNKFDDLQDDIRMQHYQNKIYELEELDRKDKENLKEEHKEKIDELKEKRIGEKYRTDLIEKYIEEDKPYLAGYHLLVNDMAKKTKFYKTGEKTEGKILTEKEREYFDKKYNELRQIHIDDYGEKEDATRILNSKGYEAYKKVTPVKEDYTDETFSTDDINPLNPEDNENLAKRYFDKEEEDKLYDAAYVDIDDQDKYAEEKKKLEQEEEDDDEDYPDEIEEDAEEDEAAGYVESVYKPPKY